MTSLTTAPLCALDLTLPTVRDRRPRTSLGASPESGEALRRRLARGGDRGTPETVGGGRSSFTGKG
jgi:hypothetical protein